jgi:hypothetical protein
MGHHVDLLRQTGGPESGSFTRLDTESADEGLQKRKARINKEEHKMMKQRPEELIADKAYDSMHFRNAEC